MTIKKLLTIVLVTAQAASMGATDLYVYSKDKPQAVAQLSGIGSVDFGTDDITVSQLSGAKTTIAIADVDFMKFTPANIVTAIGDTPADGVRLVVAGNKISVAGGTIAGIYGQDGRMMAPAAQGLHEMPLPGGCRRGIYIVKVQTSTGTVSYKLTR